MTKKERIAQLEEEVAQLKIEIAALRARDDREQFTVYPSSPSFPLDRIGDVGHYDGAPVKKNSHTITC